MTVGIKQGQSGLTTADISGTYEIATLENSADAGSLLAITFDGTGNISGGGMRNDGGTIANINMTGTYSVAADGTLTVRPTGASQMTGSVSVDGQKLVLTNLNAGDAPSAWFGVLRASFDPWGY
jgi:hypothetical protein